VWFGSFDRSLLLVLPGCADARWVCREQRNQHDMLQVLSELSEILVSPPPPVPVLMASPVALSRTLSATSPTAPAAAQQVPPSPLASASVLPLAVSMPAPKEDRPMPVRTVQMSVSDHGSDRWECSRRPCRHRLQLPRLRLLRCGRPCRRRRR
jgi:hypothetical protein